MARALSLPGVKSSVQKADSDQAILLPGSAGDHPGGYNVPSLAAWVDSLDEEALIASASADALNVRACAIEQWVWREEGARRLPMTDIARGAEPYPADLATMHGRVRRLRAAARRSRSRNDGREALRDMWLRDHHCDR